jgi:pimeloyl-ACP methyl ester carboxylesterase
LKKDFPALVFALFGLALSSPVMISPSQAAGDEPYREKDVTFAGSSDGVELAGTLTVPCGPGPFPAVLLVAGSGPLNRDEEIFGHRPFAALADHLARRGLAVLRYDKRGVGKSTGDFAQATTLDFARDAISAGDFLATRPEVEAERVGAVGHSEGGMIVPTLAAKRPKTAFIVMLAGVGMTGGDLELLQNSLLKKAEGVDPEDLAYEEETTRRWISMVKAGDTDTQIEEALRPRLEATAAKTGGDAKRAIARLHSPWWRCILTHSAIPDLEKVRCPVMALNGSKDLQVPPRENLVPIARALAGAGNTDFLIREIPGLNHLFQHAITGSESEYGKIKEPIAPEVVAMVGDWISEHTQPASSSRGRED